MPPSLMIAVTPIQNVEKSYPTYITREDESSSDGYILVKKVKTGVWGLPNRIGNIKIYSEIGVNYEKSIGSHNLTALALYNQQKRWYPDRPI